jgi:elongation factor G
MRVYPSERIRNVVLVGHGSVGKTSITEAALFTSGVTNRMGNVEEQNTVSDYDEDEHNRKFSISLSLLPLEWEKTKINFIDTPGYADFISEVICGARAADLALVVVDGMSGIEVGTDRAWDIADQLSLPRMVVVNRLDRENADFDTVVAALQEKWGHKVAPLQIPIGSERDFKGVVDLLHLKAYMGPDGNEEDVPAELADRVETLRSALIEAIAENDEDLMNKYFEDEVLTEDELVAALRRELVAGEIVPVLCTSATEQTGIEQLLHTIVRAAPSPAERPRAIQDGSEIRAGEDGPPAVLVFKTSADPYVGRLTYLRVVRGDITPDVHLWNTSKKRDERLHTLFTQRGKDQEQVDSLPAGDIGVVAKLAESGTGDTLTEKGHEVQLLPIEFPSPVYSMSVRPAGKAGVDKMGPSLQRLVEEDPGLQLSRDPVTSETILGGLGDAHLEVAVGRLHRKFNVDVELSLPRVPYRETITKASAADYTHKKQSGGHGQYARVSIRVNPQPRGAGLTFKSSVVGGSVPREFIPAVDKGVLETAREGVLAGYELTDCEVELFDGKHHPVDSSEMAFRLAATHALREAVDGAHGQILEPIMTIRVRVPEQYAGDVVGDLNTKRARIHGIVPDGAISVIEAEVPLAEVQRYASDLRSITQGRGGFELEFDHYGEMPAMAAQKVIDAHEEATV